MARDWSKAQTYYTIEVWFRHGTKKYQLSTKEALEAFLVKADENDTILHYVVLQHTIFVYPNWQSKKLRNG